MRRVALLVAVALVILVSCANPASAHGAGEADATSYVTTVDEISPGLTGVQVRVVEADDGLELRNDGPEVIVLGYRDEPYLRVGPDGAFENRLSPTVAANRRHEHGPDSVAGADPAAAAPEWRKISGRPVVRWHDHRTHWEGPNPPGVEARPGERQVVQPPWRIGLRRGPETATLSGQLTWVPGPSPAPWLALAAAAFLGFAAIGLLRRWGPPLAVALSLLLGVDLLHAGAAGFASADGLGGLVRVVGGSFYSIVGWVLAGVAVRLLAKARVDGLYAGVFAGLSIGVFGGLLDLPTLSRSSASFALPLDVARACIALAAGGGFGAAAACLLVIRRTPEARRVVGGPGQGTGDRAGDGSADRRRRQPVGADGA